MSFHDNDCEGSTEPCCCTYRKEIEALRRERDELQDKCNNFASKCRTAIAESDALNLELQKRDELVEGMYQKMWKDFVSLQRGDARLICKDAARYRWLKENHLQTGPDSWIRTGDDLEEAIDEGMTRKS